MIEVFYDVMCIECGKHLSTDFNTGFLRSKKEAKEAARENGFRLVSDTESYCPYCKGKKGGHGRNSTQTY